VKLNRDEMLTLCSGVVGHVFGAVVVVMLTLVTVYVGSGVIGSENPAQSSSLSAAQQTAQPTTERTAQDQAPEEAPAGNDSGGQAAPAPAAPEAGTNGAAVALAHEEDYYEYYEGVGGYYED